MDVNDRNLRQIITGVGPQTNGLLAESGFDITPASEIMAIMCFATSLDDLKTRIGNILLGFDYNDKPFYVRDMGVEGSIAVLLMDALKPNLVQTTEGTPAFVHWRTIRQHRTWPQLHRSHEDGPHLRRLRRHRSRLRC